MSDDNTRLDSGALVQEEAPSLADFFEEPTGEIPLGWHSATIVEGYATRKGHQMATGDEQWQDKRRLSLCFALHVGTQTRNLNESFFYDREAFSPENLARIKDMREQFKGVKSWPGQGQAQNFSITLGKLSQLEKAIGFKLLRNPNGQIQTAHYIGKTLDVRVGKDKKDYYTLTAFAPSGTQVKKAASAR